MEQFFVKQEIRDLCSRGAEACRRAINSLGVEHEDAACYTLIGVFLTSAARYGQEFDEHISLNIEYIGGSFFNNLSEFCDGEGSGVLSLFSYCYRMTVELSISKSGDLYRDLRNALEKSRPYVARLNGEAREQIRYADHQMVVDVVKKYIHHPSMVELSELPDKVGELKKVYQDFDNSLSEREDRVNALKKVLEEHEDAFNFVGLYDGFKGLRRQKKFDSYLNLALLWIVGLGIAVLPFSKVLAEILGRTSDLSLGGYITFLGLELVLIFFFRVCLHSYKSVKAQLLQIELRMTLCQFVQSYARYAKEIRTDDKDLLVQFEKIVFSGIVNSEDAIPSTFDGLEKIAELIKAVKTK